MTYGFPLSNLLQLTLSHGKSFTCFFFCVVANLSIYFVPPVHVCVYMVRGRVRDEIGAEVSVSAKQLVHSFQGGVSGGVIWEYNRDKTGDLFTDWGFRLKMFL